jgi:hypothetical protein
MTMVTCPRCGIEAYDHTQLFDPMHAARRQPGRQRMQAPRKSDMQAIGQEGDEDVLIKA